MNKKKYVIVASLSFAVFLFITLFYFFGFFSRLENIAYDGTVRFFREEESISDDIAVILIDEQSLQALNPVVGRWPWPRAIYSDLLHFLSMGNPRAVLFDILFTENQKDSGSDDLSENDMALVMATEDSGFVYHAMQIFKDEEDEVNISLLNLPLPEDFVERFSLKETEVTSALKEENNKYYIPFTELFRASSGIAVVEFNPDNDGVYRKTDPIREYQKQFYPVMGIAPLIRGKPIEIGKKKITVDDRTIPLDGEGKYLVNFYGNYNDYSISGVFASLESIQRGDIENIMVDPAEFENKIVFIGASAVGVEDLKPTPIDPRTPGVYLHAALASNYLLNEFLTPPKRWVTVIIVLICIVLSISGIFFMKKIIYKIVTPLAISILWTLFYLYQFSNNILYEFIPPFDAILASIIVSFGYLFVTEGREKLKVRKMFSQYVSPDVLSEVIDKYSDYTTEDFGRKVDITVLFSDIRGFTTFSDDTPPEKVVKMLNCFFSNMSDVIFHNQGTIDKFIGDAIMAFWGAPLKIADHPDKAVMTALDMMKSLKGLNEELEEKGFDFKVEIGIGINTGDAILGNIGSERKLNYTVVGDTINLASRLETLTKTYGCPVIISEFTRNSLKRDIPCRVVDQVKVRGKQELVTIYEPFFFEDEESMRRARDLCLITNQAFELYQQGDYRKALEQYHEIQECELKNIFVKRCEDALSSEKI